MTVQAVRRHKQNKSPPNSEFLISSISCCVPPFSRINSSRIGIRSPPLPFRKNRGGGLVACQSRHFDNIIIYIVLI